MKTRIARHKPAARNRGKSSFLPKIVSISPLNGQVIRQFEQDSEAEIEAKLQASADAFKSYRRTVFSDRANLLVRAAAILEVEKPAIARTMTLEMGKPIRASVQEVEKCATACRFYAENGAGFLADHHVAIDAAQASIKYQPLGPVLAVMPWNFPFWQVFRFAAPALMAGNTGLLKHASNVPQCALNIADCLRRAGFPEGVFQVVLVGSDRVNRIIEDRRIAAVTLTGSVGAGRSVAAAAGKAIKKSVLELGGSDPFIVMPSANMERAVRIAVQARTINNGQSCIAAKRFIVHRRIADEFERRFVEQMSKLKVGDPLDESTDVGPLATRDVLVSLEAQIRQTLRLGGRLLLGGKRLKRPGFFFPPTVLADPPLQSPACGEELFGPVASLFRADDIEEAIRIANHSDFGLGSCIWTDDPDERNLFVDEIQAGLVFVNGMVASTPALPFGGIKLSGYGRELGPQGLLEFVNVKTVVRHDSAPPPGNTE